MFVTLFIWLHSWPNLAGKNLARACGVDQEQACPVSQSTTISSSFPASRANDGLLDSFSHTDGAPGLCGDAGNDPIPSWRVDFGYQTSIAGGKIWGRADCCQGRLDGFQIWVGDSNAPYNATGNTNYYTAVTTEHRSFPYTHTFNLSSVARGRFLFVVLPSGQCLTLREVEIYPSGEYGMNTAILI
jgi:hypothetical protein